jgi:NAD-dependent dihydropyrimidine dehydrogenase PreA subunit
MTRTTPVWEAPPDIVELLPDVSGNTLNGVGEPDVRSPTVVMWANPSTIAHGPIQVRMTEEFVADPDLAAVLRLGDRHTPAPVSDERQPGDAAHFTAAVERFALEASPVPVELVGVAAVDPGWFYEGRTRDLPWAIVLGVVMDHERLSAVHPDKASAQEVHTQYNRGTAAARALADHIRGLGYEAEGHGGPGAGPMLLIPAALAAGFGELGKHGSLINRRYGSSFRLAAVLTDLPLQPSRADRIGADEFCAGCRVCTDACPPGAIGPDKALVRGVEKWYVDFDRCLPYFALSYGCGICIAVCPWSKPGAGPRLADNMLRKLARHLPGDLGDAPAP